MKGELTNTHTHTRAHRHAHTHTHTHTTEEGKKDVEVSQSSRHSAESWPGVSVQPEQGEVLVPFFLYTP